MVGIFLVRLMGRLNLTRRRAKLSVVLWWGGRVSVLWWRPGLPVVLQGSCLGFDESILDWSDCLDGED